MRQRTSIFTSAAPKPNPGTLYVCYCTGSGRVGSKVIIGEGKTHNVASKSTARYEVFVSAPMQAMEPEFAIMWAAVVLQGVPHRLPGTIFHSTSNSRYEYHDAHQ